MVQECIWVQIGVKERLRCERYASPSNCVLNYLASTLDRTQMEISAIFKAETGISLLYC